MKGVPQLGRRVGNWLTTAEGEQLLSGFVTQTFRDKRDLAIISLLLGCGLRRSEVVALKVGDIQRREDHWAIIDLVGKAGHVRTVPVPGWVKAAIDAWTQSACVVTGKLFRAVRKNGTVCGDGITQNVIWYVVKDCATRVGIKTLAPHDLRRTCARLCHGWRRTGADPVLARPCIRSGDREIHRVQTRSLQSCQRSPVLHVANG